MDSGEVMPVLARASHLFLTPGSSRLSCVTHTKRLHPLKNGSITGGAGEIGRLTLPALFCYLGVFTRSPLQHRCDSPGHGESHTLHCTDRCPPFRVPQLPWHHHHLHSRELLGQKCQQQSRPRQTGCCWEGAARAGETKV